jgi:hypothetical protein
VQVLSGQSDLGHLAEPEVLLIVLDDSGEPSKKSHPVVVRSEDPHGPCRAEERRSTECRRRYGEQFSGEV